jgi:Plasmid pRiA4b ORF-3-like protein
MATKRSASPQKVYQPHVTLRDSEPPIWRRLQVMGNTSLANLHWIVQLAMGWTNSHLHQFLVGEQYYSDPAFEPEETADETGMTLASLKLEEDSQLVYEYDFGDGWLHDILVEKIRLPEKDTRYPRCLDGERAAPTEDCGGMWGYVELLEAIGDPTHPEHDSLLEWLGEPFDPDALDLAAVNRSLRSLWGA